MNAYAGDGITATDAPASSANINGSNFGHNTHIDQRTLNIFFRNLRNPASSHVNNPSGAVQAQLDKKEKIDCRRSLSFRDIDARLQNISPVCPGTCDWFFETPQFRNWYDRVEHDNGLLWIKGNPGTGKSTLVKRILEYCQAKEDYLIAAYFFNARGAELEKTPLGMLRSLLFQLLEHEPILYDQLLPMFRKKKQDHRPDDWEWREPELTNYFLSEIPKCQSKPLLLIIDALDECSERDVQKVAEFLQHLSTNAVNAGRTLNICLSSRHYPFVRFERYRELVLEKEKQHDEDITNYISAKLAQRDEAIEEAIREKSSGIFMWVVLVITILNRAYDDGKIDAMKQKLDETPAELGEVFETLLNSNNPDKDETILILQWVLLAKRLLKPEEIYFALIAGTNSQALGIWDRSQLTPDIIRRRIISCSRGLVEIRKGEDETVQFIHKSVDDFLVRNNRLQNLDPGLAPNPIAKSHDRLKDCCMSYLMMESLKLCDDEAVSSTYPFLEYAARFVFDHAEESTLVGQTELLRTLQDDSIFKHVGRFYNDFIFTNSFRGSLNLLQILAARGLSKSIVTLLELGADINAQGRPHGTALEAAVFYSQEKTVEILLNKGAKIDIREKFTDNTILRKAFNSFSPNAEILAMLIEKGAKFNTWERLKGSLLYKAIATGNKDIIAMALSKRAKINARALDGTALIAAAGGREKEIVEMLLEKGAKVNAYGLGGTALIAAAGKGNEEIVEILLEKGAKVNAHGLGGTALIAAAGEGEKEIMEILLKRGAKVNAYGLFGTALIAAAGEGKKEIIEILLEKGAKVNAHGLFGTAIMEAARSGHKEIVEMLLKRGAKVNACGLFGTALMAAARSGHKEIVEILLKRGAEVNVWAFDTALIAAAAAEEGGKEIVEMLLEKGAKVNAHGLFGTAIMEAARSGHKEIVEMLLKRGAKVNACGLFGTALIAAVCSGNREIVEMLLKKGANVNARGLIGLEYLRREEGSEAQEMLLKKRFKVGALGKFYGTALEAAVVAGQEEIANLLLERGAKA